ncbi:23S rRNA (pseudouridine(1915)-N(3))-methyltransferase RlmH [Candidatus Saccharibacteria bacterium]|nr:23S rRNA (pseudouridine(1915)-N(3))-methyltransferase RlmH [Candidatus Saccharibacteria bacterium]
MAIGKKHNPKLQSAIEDYTKRLNRYAHTEWNLVEAKIAPSMKPEQIRQLESGVILRQLDESDTVVLLDERGTELSSPKLANKLQGYKNTSVKNLVFVIGGAFGVNNDVMQRADFTWSLSKLVLPHQLVRVVLAEQLYRAHTILAGEQYHHM